MSKSEITTAESAPAESASDNSIPRFRKDAEFTAKTAGKAAFLLAICQPGKPMHAYWLSPNEDSLREATLDVILLMQAAKRPRHEILEKLQQMHSANSSALSKFIVSKITLPSGESAVKASATPTAPDLAWLDLPASK